MESGNSSSMQSSSGAAGGGGDGDGGGGEDQEYESSGRNNNYFFNTTTTNATPPPLQYHPSMQQFIFSTNPSLQPQTQTLPTSENHNNSSNNFLDTFNDQSNYQNIMFWPQQPAITLPLSQSLVNNTFTNHLLPPATNKPSTITPSGKGTGAASGSAQKNPRKRTRASRRAPTTVLTTDTTNFRAMVQEFTGIPSSPFSTSASPLLSRLTDLFTGSGSGGSVRPLGLGGGHLERLLSGYSNNTNNNHNYPFKSAPQKPLLTNPSSNNNLSFEPGAISSTINRYNSPGGLLSGDHHGAHFQELSWILGNNHHQMFLSSTSDGNTNNMPPPQMSGGRDGGGGGGCWRGVPLISPRNDEVNNTNHETNQQLNLEGTISGGGNSNYDSNLNNNNNNVSSTTDNSLGASGAGGQGTLGNFLD